MYREFFDEHFDEVEDARYDKFVEHKLKDVLIIIMCGVLCGLDELQDIIDYAKANRDFLRDSFCVETVPSKSTLTRIMNMINAKQVAGIIVNIMREALGVKGEVLAFDGKTIRATAKGNREKLHIMSAYLTESGVVVAQEVVDEKTNEIPVMQQMLEYLDVQGKVVTADALHCQKETAALVHEGGGDYIFGLKANQATLYGDISLYLDDCISSGSVTQKAQTKEKNGGRIETRILYKAPSLSWLENRCDWPGLSSAFAIERITETHGETTRERSYYITSLDCEPTRLLYLTREHWKIEAMHHMLDVTFSEDDCRILSSSGQQAMNAFRKLALALHTHYINSLSQKTKPSKKNNMFKALLSHKTLTAVLASALTSS